MDFNTEPRIEHVPSEDPFSRALRELLETLLGVESVTGPRQANDPSGAARNATSSLLTAALASATKEKRDSLERDLVAFAKLCSAHKIDTAVEASRRREQWHDLPPDVKAAAKAIWKEAADVVGRAVTQQNLLREYQEDLIRWRRDPQHARPVEKEDIREVRRRYPTLASVWDAMEELARHLLMEVVQAAVIELLFPGAHLVLPPDNLVSALFAAAGLGDHLDGVA